MPNVVVSDRALRELVNEALDGVGFGDLTVPDPDPIEPNAVVDPSAADTDPMNSNAVPQNRVELDVAMKRLSRDVPDDMVPSVFKAAKAAISIEKEKREEGDSMKTKNENNVEETVRRAVRKVLSEINPRFDTSYSGIDYGTSADDDDDDDKKPKRAYKSTAIGNMADVGGASFDEIAKELGFSIPGAKQAVDKALLKAQFVAKSDPDELEIIVLTTMNDYIKKLAKTGELSSADVELMKNHPEIVRELDGFREFLHSALKRMQKGGQSVENPLGEGKKKPVAKKVK